MSLYRNILVALDGSADSRTALRHAVTLARDQNAKLTLLTVAVAVPLNTIFGLAAAWALRLFRKNGLATVPHRE